VHQLLHKKAGADGLAQTLERHIINTGIGSTDAQSFQQELIRVNYSLGLASCRNCFLSILPTPVRGRSSTRRITDGHLYLTKRSDKNSISEFSVTPGSATTYATNTSPR